MNPSGYLRLDWQQGLDLAQSRRDAENSYQIFAPVRLCARESDDAGAQRDWSLSGRVLAPSGEFIEATLILQAGRIAQVRPGLDAGADIRTAGWIAPGLIDLQVNGAYGHDFSLDAGAIRQAAARLPETGVTAFLPTIITSPFEAYPRVLQEAQQAANFCNGARVLGVHLEGPYLNPARAGAHNPELFRRPNPVEVEQWADHPPVRLVTLAPELPDALEAVRRLRARGIVVSAGHSDATAEEAQAGFEAGVDYGTHLFNAMSGFNHRAPGLAGALLASSVPCGLIADGIHVHPTAARAAFRAKGPDGLTLVTDAMAAMGMSPGRYTLADRTVIVDEHSARLPDGTLAGSILTLDQAVRNMMAFTGCTLAQALTMASATPARVLGLTRLGRIAPGCEADVVVFDEALRVTHTFVAGKLVYPR